jgi:hypothetical protein
VTVLYMLLVLTLIHTRTRSSDFDSLRVGRYMSKMKKHKVKVITVSVI